MTPADPIKMLNVTGLPTGPMEEILNIIQSYTGRVDAPVDFEKWFLCHGCDEIHQTDVGGWEQTVLVGGLPDDRP